MKKRFRLSISWKIDEMLNFIYQILNSLFPRETANSLIIFLYVDQKYFLQFDVARNAPFFIDIIITNTLGDSNEKKNEEIFNQNKKS